MAITRRSADKWIIDFGWTMEREEAALYEPPLQHAQKHVYPMRQRNRSEVHRLQWWRHLRPRQDTWQELRGLSRTSSRQPSLNTACSRGSMPVSVLITN